MDHGEPNVGTEAAFPWLPLNHSSSVGVGALGRVASKVLLPIVLCKPVHSSPSHVCTCSKFIGCVTSTLS